MARRFLPVILPGALLFASGAALAGAHSGSARTRVIAELSAPCSSLLLALQYARMAAPLQNHVEYAGIIPKIEQLAAGIQDNDLLIVESRDASDTHVLALPLAYIYAATSCCCVHACRTSQHSRRSSTGPTSDTPACCSWAAAAPSCSRDDGMSAQSPASDSRSRSSKPADTRFRGRCGGRSSTTASTSSCRLAPAPRSRRDRRRHTGRPARPPLSRQGNGQRALVPMDA